MDRLVDKVRYQKSKSDKDDDLASDGVITDMAYCQERSLRFFYCLSIFFYHCCSLRNEFAYSSTDKLVYIRKFAETGSEMKMAAVLQGHESDVTQLRFVILHFNIKLCIKLMSMWNGMM